MAQVKFSRVISVTSEDPKYPAKNLLNASVPTPWKCKEPGEKQAAVILQLEESCLIQGIDIGNQNSAFIEIFVGKSVSPDNFEILRVTSVLMSVQDSKNEENKNTVRFFTHDEFSKPAANQSWDRVKIVCTQPFNRYAQYGLSFVKVHAKKEAAPVKNSIFGKFALKKEDNNDESISAGSLFAKRKNLSDDVSAATAIKQASNDINSPLLNRTTMATKRLSDVLPNKNSKKARMNGDYSDNSTSNDCRRSATGPLLYSQDELEDQKDEGTSKTNTPTNTPSSARPDKNHTPKAQAKKPDTSSTNKPDPPSAPKNKTKVDTPKQRTPKNDVQKRPSQDEPSASQKKAKFSKERKRKAFNKLLEGVVFAISGYQNPFRAELRSKALKMGAKYRADWDNSCTHLICAFSNTPKFNQVLGQGWIVRKDWIEDCHQLRKRLLSSGYKLDKNDPYTNSNDEEIWELDKNAKPDPVPEPSHEEEKINSQPSRASSPNEEISSQNLDQSYSGSSERTNQVDVYDAETDIDSEHEDPQLDLKYETVRLKVLPDIFKNIKFYFGTDLLQSTVNLLRRYIIAYKGEPHEDVDEVTYIISEDTRYKENVSGTPVLLPDWIWECNDQKKLVPIDNYLLQ